MRPLILPPLTESLKSIIHLLDVATEYETGDPIICYWGKRNHAIALIDNLFKRFNNEIMLQI